MKKYIFAMAFVLLSLGLMSQDSCDDTSKSDRIQKQQQAVLLDEATKQVGMPAIKNFRERKILKDILELRDQNGLTTYTYLWSDVRGCAKFLGHSVGYGIPYSTQFTNPQYYYVNGATLPQADPNGLFSPESSEGTWILMKNPNGDEVTPLYVEPRTIVSTFPLNEDVICR